MSKIILSDGTEAAVTRIYTSGQNRISLVLEDSKTDIKPFAEADSFIYSDDENREIEYSDMVFVEAVTSPSVSELIGVGSDSEEENVAADSDGEEAGGESSDDVSLSESGLSEITELIKVLLDEWELRYQQAERYNYSIAKYF